MWQEKVDKKTILAFFLLQCAGPICFYFLYIYCANILKTNFGYSIAEIIQHNFMVCLMELITLLTLSYLSFKVYPLVTVKIILIISAIFILFCPYLLNNINSPYQLLLIQFVIVLLEECLGTSAPIFYKNFPVFKRFTCVGMVRAVSRALMYIIIAFGFAYITDYFGHWGLLVVMIPIIIGFAYGLFYFDRLAKKYGDLPIAFRNTATYSEENNY